MWMYEPFDASVKLRQLRLAALSNRVDGRRVVNEIAGAEDWGEQIFMLKCRGQQLAASHVSRIDDHDVAGRQIVDVVDRVADETG